MTTPDSYIFTCPHCGEPIGSLRPYTGTKGRRKGAGDATPRAVRMGDINKAIMRAKMEEAG
jgi:hypothetical protein